MTTQIAGSATRQGPHARDFWLRMRGGGLLTVAVNQRVGAALCVPAHRLGLAPSVLTLLNLILGVGGSVLLGLVATTRSGAGPLAGLGAFVLWQAAYCFDCADGQLARYTERSSEAGARLDVLCDLAVHASVVVAIVVTAGAHVPQMPRWLGPAFACAVMINLCASVMVTSGPAAGSLFADNNRAIIRAGSLVFDYSVFLTAYAVLLIFMPDHLDLFLLAVTAVSTAFLLARVAKAAAVSLRPRRR